MPTMEMRVPTRPMHAVSGRCGWCAINLRAIPDPPIPLTLETGKTRYYHPGCAEAVLSPGPGSSDGSSKPSGRDPR
jgi:hypothetical protein